METRRAKWLIGLFAAVLLTAGPGLLQSNLASPTKGIAQESDKTAPKQQTGSQTEQPITFSEHIAPILFNKCASCHHEGEVAPFPLMSFEDAFKRADTINAVTTARYMPPWKPAPGFGNFQECRALTESEIRSIQEWVAQGAKQGDKSMCPPAPKFTSEWRLGAPDLVLKMPETYHIPASGPDIYRCFVIPTGLTKNRFVSAVEFKPGNRKVVHHAIFFLDNMGVARKKDAADKEAGFASFGGPGFVPTGGLGGWAPGNSQQPLPDGISRIIRAGSDLVIQEHFHPTGKPEEEQSTIGIYFSKTTPKRLLMPLVVRTRGIDIPAGVKDHKVHASFDVPIDMQAINVTPHAHLLCKEIKAVAHLPNDQTLPIIWIRNWDFNWQEQYTFDPAIKLPKGTRIDADFVYDNSEDNPRNPNRPPKRVHWGEQTTDEMAILFFGAIAENQSEVPDYMRAMLKKNAALILQGNPGQLFNLARQILHADRRFGQLIPNEQQSEKSKPKQPRTVESHGTDTKPNQGPPSAQSEHGTISGAQLPLVTSSRQTNSEAAEKNVAKVFLFLAVDCPISNRYSPDLRELAKKHANRGVEFIGVYTDLDQNEHSIAEHKAKFNYPFKVVQDKNHELQKRFAATTTPEAVVLDAAGNLVYKGRIDDRYLTFGTVRPAPTQKDLEHVLELLEEGKPVERRITKAVGCTIPGARQ